MNRKERKEAHQTCGAKFDLDGQFPIIDDCISMLGLTCMSNKNTCMVQRQVWEDFEKLWVFAFEMETGVALPFRKFWCTWAASIVWD